MLVFMHVIIIGTCLPGVLFITFIEQTGGGNVIFTSVFPNYAKGTEDFISVTSRHVNLPGGPLPLSRHFFLKISSTLTDAHCNHRDPVF
jgi:hypothetical protein